MNKRGNIYGKSLSLPFSSQNTMLKSGWKIVIVNNVIMLTMNYGLFNELLNEIHPLVLPVGVGLLP